MSFKEIPLMKMNEGTVLFHPYISKNSFKNTAILEMPDKSQIVVFEGHIIGKEKAIVKTINQDNIILKLVDKNLQIKINK